MAQRVVVELEDDLNGDPADQTITFAVDGVMYEIDLTNEHAAQLRASFAPWLHGARVLGSQDSFTMARDTLTAPDPTAVRRWAQANRIEVSPRGRIPSAVVAQFQAAGN